MVFVRKHFDNMADFANAAAERTGEPWGDSSRYEGKPDWSGTKTFEEAINLNKFGWEAGRKMMFKELQDMKALATGGDLPTWGHDVAGFLPDVPRAIVGMPDCMFSYGEYTHRAKPIIRVLANLGRLADIEAASINWHGAAILSWIDRLEALGFAVEVTAAMQSNVSGDKNYISVVLKEAGEVLDIDRMAFALANPAFHRRLKFGVMENIPELHMFDAGYGSSADLSEPEKEGFTVYIYKISQDYHNRQHALDNVSNFFKSHLAKAGIVLPGEDTL